MPKIVVIGGGIVGLATGLKLARAVPTARVVVLEKEREVGLHQSTHNSGVLHSGLYYRPGSLKARLAVEGILEMTQFAQEHGIPHEICGKIVLAVNAVEVSRLRELQSRGTQNGLAGLKWIEKEEIRDHEPAAVGEGALHVPQEGIIDYRAVVVKMKELLCAQGHEVHTNSRVTRIAEENGRQIISTPVGEEEADFIVNCAGLHSDRVFELTGEKPSCRIIPFRGAYYQLKPAARKLVRHLIYPVPDPQFPFLGVHFTRMTTGEVEAGPTALLAFRREGYRATDFSLRDAFDSLTFPGLLRFMARFPKSTFQEICNVVSRRAFLKNLQRLVPSITAADLEPGGAGVRAQAMNRRGDLVMDFWFEEKPGQLHVLNAPSPGATASLAIGGYIAEKVKQRLAA